MSLLEEERRERFERTNELLVQNGLNPLRLPQERREEEPCEPERRCEQLEVAEALGLNVLEWKAISGTAGTVQGLHVDKATLRVFTRKPDKPLLPYAKYRVFKLKSHKVDLCVRNRI